MATPQVPISICVIAKNEELNIEPFYNSFKDILTHPDDEVVLVDTGSCDKTVEIAQEYGWKVIDRSDLCSKELVEKGKKKFDKIFDEYGAHGHFKDGILTSFAEARQASFDAAQNDVCMWFDLDDDLVNGHLLRAMIDNVASKSSAQGKGFALFLRYDYSFDDNGQCNTILWRERIVSKKDFYWKGGCHETLLPLAPDYMMARDVDCPVIISHRTPKQHQFSDLRNYIILKNDMDKTPDARTLFYLANACRGLKLFEESIHWYSAFVPQSGNKEDILASWINMAYCWAQLGDKYKAIDMCLQAQKVSPDDPRVYYTAAAIWGEMGHWKNVILYVKLGDQLKLQDTMHAVDPATIGYQPALALTQAFRHLNLPEQALQASERLLRCSPDEATKKLVQDLGNWANAEISSTQMLSVVQHADDPQEALKHFKLSPHIMDRGIAQLETVSPGAKEGVKTVTFFCGQSATTWGPPGKEKGVGASEKMVYEAARRLVKQGHNVQVYCRLNRPEGVCEEGINWYYSGRFNPSIYRDVVVVWRVPQYVSQVPLECGKCFVWMHDVGDNNVWDQRLLTRIDKVFFLSEYHRSLHPNVPNDKVYLTRNGIDLANHLYTGDVKKKKKIIYFSSPDRGWCTAIEAFNKSKLAKKGYELHMFYGFGELWQKLASENEYGYIVELGIDTRFYEYESKCRQMALNSKGVVFRGKVGWGEMAKELKDSSIWLYPTKFDEISCVAAMEAMAAGCKIVATEHAALKETLKGYPGWFKTTPSKAAKSLRLAASSKEQPAKLAEFAKKFDMDKLTEAWEEDLFKGDNGHDDIRPSHNGSTKEDGEERFGF